jgi:hypothetical protein
MVVPLRGERRMRFDAHEKLLAMATAYRALVIALIESQTLDPDLFESHCIRAVARLDAIGETEGAAAAAELLEPLTSDIRRFRQFRDGSQPDQGS